MILFNTYYKNLKDKIMNHKNLISYISLITVITGGMLLTVKPACAQVKLYQISGTVADSATRRPLDLITVNLKNDKMVPVQAKLTGTDGSFVLKGLPSSKYMLTIVAVGYQTKTIRIDVTDSSKQSGTLFVARQNNKLKEIVITADKPIIKQEIDRISYDLQADPESKVNSVLEMLRKVPFVSLDGDDNILLKGNSSYKILINGKPSSMMERDPKTILRSMPASTIQRIEVITIPPSKYDAEGLAGIINIITNKKVDNGYNGTLNINERYPQGPALGMSFTVKEGKFGINGYGGASVYNSPTTAGLNTRITTGTDPTNLEQQSSGSSSGRSGYFGTELSYEIDSLNLVSGQLNINGNKSNGNSSQTSLLTDQTGILQGFNLSNLNNATGKGLDASINYQLGFKANKLQLLTFSYSYSTYSNLSYTGISIYNPVNYTTPDYNQDNRINPTEQTVQVDYVQPLKNVNFEVGLKGIFRDNSSDFQYNSFDATSGIFLPNPLLTNDFNDKQDILSAYNTWQYSGKGWGIKGGLRMEHTLTNANFISTASTVHQNYFNVIPSIVFNKDFKDHSGINIGFTKRIQRPGIGHLNPYVDRSNPDFETTGNPNLAPGLINSIQLGYHFSKKAQVNLALTYDFANNIDLQVSTFNPASNITTSTDENIGKASRIGSNININYPLTKKWNFSLNGNAMHYRLNDIVNGVPQTFDFFTYNISASTGYSLNKGWRANASLNINGLNPSGFQSSSAGFVNSSVSINKEIIKSKLIFAASVNNPFDKYRDNITETNGTGFTQTMLNQVYFRSFRASLNYSFGKLKGDIKKTKKSINNDDIAK